MERMDWMTRRILLVVLCLLLPVSALAQSYKIGEVAVSGNRRVDKGAILAVLSVKAGQTVTLADIDRDVRAIYKLDRFKDVAAELEQQNGANILTYRVQELPLVRRVKFSGGKKFDDKKLRSFISVKTPSFYDPAQVEKSAAAIRKNYIDEGYYAVTVTPKLTVNKQNEGTLTFAIKEGTKVLIRHIRFTGNTVFTGKQLRKVMTTKERWFLSWLTGRGAYKEDVLNNDLELIADQYYNKGYVEVKVHKPHLSMSKDKKSMDITIGIEEGPQFRVGEVNVSGDLLKSKSALLDMVKLKTGDVFSRAELRKGVFALNDLYADRGYAYVNVSPLTRVDEAKRTIDLTFQIEQGEKVAINRIHISGNTKTRDKVIRREMKLVEGNLFSASKLKESRRQVNNLGFFDAVNVTTAKGPDEGHMDLDVAVKEKPTGTFSAGFGYSSVDKFIGQGSVTQKNFLGEGVLLNLSAAVGGKTNTYQVGLTQPYFLDTHLTLGFDLYKTRREWSDYTQSATGGDLKFGLPINDNLSTSYLYKFERKDISNVTPGSIFEDQAGKSTLSSLSASVTRDTTDYRLDPSRGNISEGSIEFAGLGGSEKFLKYIVDSRQFFPFKWGTVFSIHGRVGYIQKLWGAEIPLDERFMLGGINTMRGFRTREVGPRTRRIDTTVDPVTGKTTTTNDGWEYPGGDKDAYLNLEYIFPLAKDLGLKGVLFFDTGNVWASNENYFSTMRYSVGAGIRWVSPLGPLRFEWGYNLDPLTSEPHSQLQFSIGQFF